MVNTQSLSKLRVLVTRPQHQAQRFIDEIERLGGTAFHLPTIEIAFSESTPELINADLIIFTSVNAVIGAKLERSNLDMTNSRLFAAIGTATANALLEAGIKKVLSPSRNGNSEALLTLLGPYIFPRMKIIIVRGDSGRDTLRDGLRNLNAQVRYEQVYQRKLPNRSIAAESASVLWQRANPHIISISSDLGLANLISLLPAQFHRQLFSCPMVVNSKRCERKARSAGFTAEIAVADPPGNAGQIDQLAKYAQTKHQTDT